MFGAELQGLRREHQRWEGPPTEQPHVTIGFRKGQHKPYLDGVEALKPRHDCTSNSYTLYIYMRTYSLLYLDNVQMIVNHTCKVDEKGCIVGGWRRASQREDLT